MSFIRSGERLGNGSKSGAYVYSDGRHINIYILDGSQKKRKCDSHVKLTYEEVIAIAKSCQLRGWLDKATGKK